MDLGGDKEEDDGSSSSSQEDESNSDSDSDPEPAPVPEEADLYAPDPFAMSQVEAEINAFTQAGAAACTEKCV